MDLVEDEIRIGTRSSKLALAQVAEVVSLLSSYVPSSKIKIIPIATSGDKIQDRSLAEIGGKGLFIKELEEALLQGKIDVAIHSAKDVPPLIHSETKLVSFIKRLDPRDCFVSNKFSSLNSLPSGAIVGTSSARRKAILLNLRSDLNIVNLRGNVDTRLIKLSKGEVDAVIIAACGMVRLNKIPEIKEIIETDIMLPAGGQGALAMQTRNEDKFFSLLRKINHGETEICVKSERAFLQELMASCVTPVGVYAWPQNGSLNFKTMILNYDGSEIFKTFSTTKFTLEEGVNLGIEVAQKVKREAKDLYQKII